MPAGRPTKYKEEYNEQVYKLALLGATDSEMADFFEVDQRTIDNWKETKPKFFQSLKDGKLKADAEVSSSLFKRATGFNFEEVKTEELGNGKQRVTRTVKHIPPDVAAQNIWLKNRRHIVNSKSGLRWADKHEIDHTTNGESLNDVSKLTTEELVKRAEAVRQLKDNDTEAK